jgi:short-subunit dehydrogenase
MAIPPPRPGAAVLVTGASSGIGEAFARKLCARGHDVIVVARRRDRLETLAAELRTKHGRRVEVLECDVSDADARRELTASIEALGLEIDVAVLSAGFGMGGPFVEHDPDRVVQMLRTNVESTMLLTHAVLRGMVARRSGAVLLVASMAGLAPMPHFGAYAASKAAVVSFGEMLSEEVRGHGVTVTTLCPGAVRTEFSRVAQMEGADSAMPGPLWITPDPLADVALEGLDAGRRVIVPRPAVKALVFLGRRAPRRVWLPICRRMMSL